MDIILSEDHLAIESAIAKICADFSDEYWTE
jgi:hypothetical protein